MILPCKSVQMRKQISCERKNRRQHPRTEKDQSKHHRHDFRNERKRLFLDLSCRLKDTDEQTDDQRDRKQRPADH